MIRQSLRVVAALGSLMSYIDALRLIGTYGRATFDCNATKKSRVASHFQRKESIICYSRSSQEPARCGQTAQAAKCKQADLRMESVSLVVQAKARLLTLFFAVPKNNKIELCPCGS